MIPNIMMETFPQFTVTIIRVYLECSENSFS